MITILEVSPGVAQLVLRHRSMARGARGAADALIAVHQARGNVLARVRGGTDTLVELRTQLEGVTAHSGRRLGPAWVIDPNQFELTDALRDTLKGLPDPEERTPARERGPRPERPRCKYHPDRVHYAKGLCAGCYRRGGEPPKPPRTRGVCAHHPERPHYARGVCLSCYQAGRVVR
jgi:hypothetical protein